MICNRSINARMTSEHNAQVFREADRYHGTKLMQMCGTPGAGSYIDPTRGLDVLRYQDSGRPRRKGAGCRTREAHRSAVEHSFAAQVSAVLEVVRVR